MQGLSSKTFMDDAPMFFLYLLQCGMELGHSRTHGAPSIPALLLSNQMVFSQLEHINTKSFTSSSPPCCSINRFGGPKLSRSSLGAKRSTWVCSTSSMYHPVPSCCWLSFSSSFMFHLILKPHGPQSLIVLLRVTCKRAPGTCKVVELPVQSSCWLCTQLGSPKGIKISNMALFPA